jgi:hypothetical protein
MQELAAMNHRQWVSFLHDLELQSGHNVILQLEELLEKHNEKPGFWARDVHATIGAMRTRPPTVEDVIPRELLQRHTPEDASALHRDFFRSYGELLYWWPDNWNAALEINRSEHGRIQPGGKVQP